MGVYSSRAVLVSGWTANLSFSMSALWKEFNGNLRRKGLHNVLMAIGCTCFLPMALWICYYNWNCWFVSSRSYASLQHLWTSPVLVTMHSVCPGSIHTCIHSCPLVTSDYQQLIQVHLRVCMWALHMRNCADVLTCLNACMQNPQGAHILHAFIHTNEQRFLAIYREAILAHHMCQLLLSKWPQTTRATEGKLGGKVGRRSKSSGLRESRNKCVCVSCGCERGFGAFLSSNRSTKYSCTQMCTRSQSH